MYEYKATYVGDLDGDTIDAIVDLGFKVSLRVRIRLAVIDTPEKGQPGWTEATDFTRKWFEANPKFIVKTTPDVRGDDKSGGFDRWLGDCYSLSGESISKLLLDNGLAKVYHR